MVSAAHNPAHWHASQQYLNFEGREPSAHAAISMKLHGFCPLMDQGLEGARMCKIAPSAQRKLERGVPASGAKLIP